MGEAPTVSEWYPAHVADRGQGDSVPGGPSLSPRQLEVLALLAGGRTADTVARSLGISPSTVARHKQVAFRKLGVQSQAHAVSVAIRSGLLRAQLL